MAQTTSRTYADGVTQSQPARRELASEFSAFVADFKAKRPAPQPQPAAASEQRTAEGTYHRYISTAYATCSLCGDPSGSQVCARCNVGLTELGL